MSNREEVQAMLTMMKRLPQDAAYDVLASPVGDLHIIASSRGLHAVLWKSEATGGTEKKILSRLLRSPKHPVIKKTRQQLKEYFKAARKEFELPLVMDGTSFQIQAWNELTKIPYGRTISYQDQALGLGSAKKARAVGAANSRNPLSIIVPCHRVIAKNGNLSGFGGGIQNKKYLINLEKNKHPSPISRH